MTDADAIYDTDVYDRDTDDTMVHCEMCDDFYRAHEMYGGNPEDGYVCWSCEKSETDELYMSHRRYW